MPSSHQSITYPVLTPVFTQPDADMKQEISPNPRTIVEKSFLEAECTQSPRKRRATSKEPEPDMGKLGAETGEGVKLPLARNNEGLQLVRAHCVKAQTMNLRPEVMIQDRSGELTSITLPDVDYYDPANRESILRQFEYLTNRLFPKENRVRGHMADQVAVKEERNTRTDGECCALAADTQSTSESAVSSGANKDELQNSPVHGQRLRVPIREPPTYGEDVMLIEFYVELFLDHFQQFEAMTDCMREVNDTFRPPTLADKQYTSIEDFLKGYKRTLEYWTTYLPGVRDTVCRELNMFQSVDFSWWKHCFKMSTHSQRLSFVRERLDEIKGQT
ncbi:hypothetical protein LTR96_003070 [Exophiala xenobiotica]|nr:hypothetical protein LTR92_008933 [Exophiala xenobiotica]KAK5259429.1 hypothetical protein LTR40_006014 [Exophiala xenobiotica]KAK5271246.1 hypothetical protein LTR96_003070 [Exophiala xenobiotica]KAK5342481.1 hypothetical protein LTR98_000106 [Exophiala xenobiotica]KAK5374692.1 hypothetical protein LTS13_005260 [Exophiala xenobiotica]